MEAPISFMKSRREVPSGKHRSLAREFAMQHLDEGIALRQFFQAPPVLRTLLHPCQLVLHLGELHLAGTYRLGFSVGLVFHLLVGSLSLRRSSHPIARTSKPDR